MNRDQRLNRRSTCSTLADVARHGRTAIPSIAASQHLCRVAIVMLEQSTQPRLASNLGHRKGRRRGVLSLVTRSLLTPRSFVRSYRVGNPFGFRTPKATLAEAWLAANAIGTYSWRAAIHGGLWRRRNRLPNCPIVSISARYSRQLRPADVWSFAFTGLEWYDRCGGRVGTEVDVQFSHRSTHSRWRTAWDSS